MNHASSGLEATGKAGELATPSVEQLAKWLLTFFLLLLPFQSLPRTFLASENGSALLSAVSYSDEIAFLVSLLTLASFVLLKPETYKVIRLPLNKYLALFSFISLVSLWVNGVPLAQGFFGLYDLLKNILLIHVFSTLYFSRQEFIRIVSLLKNVAVFIAVVGIIGEALALFLGVGIGALVRDERRWGLYRVISLSGTGNWAYLGTYMNLFVFLALAIVPRTANRFFQLFSLFTCLFLTMSKQAWLGLAAMMILLKSKLRLVGFLLLPLTAVFIIQALPEFSPETYFRSFGAVESLRLLRQKPVLGVGPGMFGGLPSVLFKSPLYDDWPGFFKDMVIRVRGIDSFWPRVWAEFGLLGLLFYIGIWFSLFRLLGRTARGLQNTDARIAAAGKVLQYFLFPLAIMGMAGGLNAAFVTFTYFALVGMWLSSSLRTSHESPVC